MSGLFLELEMRNMTYDDYLAENERIKNITKEDVVKMANKYFTNDYLDIRSKMGFPAKDKVDKPNWKPIEAKNTEAKSEFAQMIEAEEVPQVKAQNIEFGKDVEIFDVNNCYKMFTTKNPYNDIFTLSIEYNYGKNDNPDLERAISYWSLQGSESKSFEDLSLAFQKIGASVYMSASQFSTTLNISGFEKDLDVILALCEEKILTPSNDEKKKDILVEDEITEDKSLKEDASTWGEAVFQYALYGDKSSFINKTPVKTWAKRNGDEILNDMRNVFNYSGNIYFVGNIDFKEVADALLKHNIIRDDANIVKKGFITEKRFDDNQIFIASNKKFRQSNIFMYVPSEILNEKDKAVAQVFNKYFGTDMYSIVFQEIREFRSLGYSAYGYFNYDYLNRKPGFLFTYLGSQSDKTNEGIEVMHGLITDMPERIEKFNASKDALIMSRSSDYISFRNIPQSVSAWVEQGYTHDPRIDMTDIIKNTEYQDVQEFYKNFVANRPIVIMMSGNGKQIDLKALEKFGNVKELKYKEIFK